MLMALNGLDLSSFCASKYVISFICWVCVCSSLLFAGSIFVGSMGVVSIRDWPVWPDLSTRLLCCGGSGACVSSMIVLESELVSCWLLWWLVPGTGDSGQCWSC